MKVRGVSCLAALFTLVLTTASYSAAPPKASAPCSQLGASQTFQGKKFTCIKSGRKLVWNKGVEVKPTPAPSPSRSTAPANLLLNDSRITPSSQLSPTEICKGIDSWPPVVKNGEPPWQTWSAFPRPNGTVFGKRDARVLIIPLNFRDVPFTKVKSTTVESTGLSFDYADYEAVQRAALEIESGYSFLSAGRFQLKVDVLPESQWWRFDFDYPIRRYDDGSQNSFEIVQMLIKDYESRFSFDKYDSFLLVSSQSSPSRHSLAYAHSQVPAKGAKDGLANFAIVTGIGMAWPQLLMHELGHTLFRLPDLYLWDQNQLSLPSGFFPPDGWDLMSAMNKLSLLNWSRFMTGWIKDSEVRCVHNQDKTTHYLSPYAENSEPKLLLIRLEGGVTLVAEARNQSDDAGDKGLLVYISNQFTKPGELPILTPKTLLTKGMSLSAYGRTLSILDTNRQGVLFDVSKA